MHFMAEERRTAGEVEVGTTCAHLHWVGRSVVCSEVLKHSGLPDHRLALGTREDAPHTSSITFASQPAASTETMRIHYRYSC